MARSLLIVSLATYPLPHQETGRMLGRYKIPLPDADRFRAVKVRVGL